MHALKNWVYVLMDAFELLMDALKNWVYVLMDAFELLMDAFELHRPKRKMRQILHKNKKQIF